MKYLLDTNLFLEILLGQTNAQRCKAFLRERGDESVISDFSLNSIGVLLFREGKEDVFHRFVLDVLPHLRVVTLSQALYSEVQKWHRQHNLDFDDSYQCCVASEYNLTVVTLDADFEQVRKSLPVVSV